MVNLYFNYFIVYNEGYYGVLCMKTGKTTKHGGKNLIAK